MSQNDNKVFAIVLRYPESNEINLYSIVDFVTDKTYVILLGHNIDIEVSLLVQRSFFQLSCDL